jgi:hypothetical protein
MLFAENQGAGIYWEEHGQGAPSVCYGLCMDVRDVVSHTTCPWRIDMWQ